MFSLQIPQTPRTRTALAAVALSALSISALSQAQVVDLRPIGTVTLTDGAYPETFENDTLRWVGNALFNRRLGKVVAIKDYDRVYRFGFHGQEKDDELHGATGTSYAFEYRMHDARAGRFLSIDPLSAKYAYYSPYVFSGNRVIDAREIEGLEPGVLFGNDEQASAVNKAEGNENYIGFSLKSMVEARIALMNHRLVGNAIKVVYLQTHGKPGVIALGEGRDGFLDTEASPPGANHFIDDVLITSESVDRFLELQLFSDGTLQGPLAADDAALTSALDGFVKLAAETDADATIILGACFTAQDLTLPNDWSSDASALLSKLSNITGRTVVSNADYTRALDETGNVLDSKRTSFDHFKFGWSVSDSKGEVTKTGQNLQLNSSGPLYDIKDQ